MGWLTAVSGPASPPPLTPRRAQLACNFSWELSVLNEPRGLACRDLKHPEMFAHAARQALPFCREPSNNKLGAQPKIWALPWPRG